jgi:predicted metalloprotease with PDZ domain
MWRRGIEAAGSWVIRVVQAVTVFAGAGSAVVLSLAVAASASTATVSVVDVSAAAVSVGAESAGAVSAAQRPPVSYRFTYQSPGQPTVDVSLDWPDPLSADGTFVMPRAIPMGYGEQHYDAFLSDVRGAGADGRAVALDRQEGPRWALPAGTTRVVYRVNLQDLEREVLAASDQSRVRDGYLGALGYSVFGYVDGHEVRPATLSVEGPADWPVFTTLTPTWPVPRARADAVAADFYALADSQIVMGPRAVIRRLGVQPVPLYLAVYAEGPVDLDRLGDLASTAFARVIAYFGSTPFTHYTVHQELLTPLTPTHAYGMSMEHLDSSTYYLAASSGLTAASPPDEQARVLYNFAHHMAHAWVPKRAYGRGYFPFTWEMAPVLDTIWFAEGWGQYAAIVAIGDGTPNPAEYRDGMLNRRFRPNVAAAPGFLKRLPLVDLSRVASTRYSEDFRTGRLVFSRGGLMAADVDDRIRSASNGTRSLRDALRHLIVWTTRARRGFADVDELARLIHEATGVDTLPEIDRWLAPLP